MLSSQRENPAQEGHRLVAHRSTRRCAENALGLSLTQTSSPRAESNSGIMEFSSTKASPSGGIVATGASIPQYAPVCMTPHPSTSPSNYYFQHPDQQYMQSGTMGDSAMAINEVPYAYPVYITTGQQFVTSPAFVTSDSRTDHQPIPYMASQPYMPAPAYQYTTSPFAHTPMIPQPSRPVSASSSGSPEEALMTPLLMHDTNSDHATHYVAPMTLDSSFSTLPTISSLPQGMEGMACVSFPQPGVFAYDMQSAGIPQSAPPQVQPLLQPPPLTRRSTGDLPFSDSPLSRSGPRSLKPYDLAYHPTRQPVVCTNRQGQPIPAPMLSMDNTFMAKQRIACEGCRAKKLKCTGSRPVCYNCAKKGRTLCHYVKEIKRRGPGKKRLESEAKAKAEGYFMEESSGVPAQFAFWTGQGDGQGQ